MLDALKGNRKTIIPAIVTMLNDDQSFDEPSQRAHVRWLLSKGLDGFYVGGSTGEGPLLPTEIKRQVIKTVVDEVAGRVPVIAYIGYIDTKSSVDLARFAEEVGADGISSVPPYYYPFSQDSIYDFYRELSESVNLPLIVYNNPGSSPTADSFERLLSLPNVGGVKYTAPNHYQMQLIKNLAGDKLVFSGMDEQFIAGIFMGADGAIGSSYNVMPETYMEMRKAFENGDNPRAVKLSRASNLLLSAIAADGRYNGNLKALLTLNGIRATATRSPMPMGDMEALRKRLIPLKTLPELACVELLQKL